jgi:hypothetical protein
MTKSGIRRDYEGWTLGMPVLDLEKIAVPSRRNFGVQEGRLLYVD